MSDDLSRARAQNARNHFELFGLPVRYTLDRQVLSARYLELTRLTHPDFAGGDAETQVAAMELSARVNEANAVLEDDLRRAEHLLELRGGAPAAQLSPEMLERVFEMREALSMAQTGGDEAEAENIRRQAEDWMGQIVEEVGARLDAGEGGREVEQLVAAARYVKKIAGA